MDVGCCVLEEMKMGMGEEGRHQRLQDMDRDLLSTTIQRYVGFWEGRGHWTSGAPTRRREGRGGTTVIWSRSPEK